MGKQSGENVYGEGNYKASRDFNKAENEFVASGKADAAAGKAAPKSEAEARELEAAEREARSRSKGEEPALTRPAPRKPSDAQNKRQR
jgi:hypothetical protein